MMNWFYLSLSVLCAALTLPPFVGWVATRLRGRRRVRDEVMLRRSTQGVVLHLLTDREGLPRLPLERLVGRQRMLALLLARLGAATYGFDPDLFRRLMLHYRLDRYLLRGVRRSWGLRRALYLKRIADLPPLESLRRATRPYLYDSSREVRFAALLVQISAAPHELLRLVASYPQRLTAGEVAELLHLLRRGLLPIAYRPLLSSPNPNLQRVGLALVAQFDIEEADERLLAMLSSPSDRPLSVAALRTLTALHRPLRARAVVLFVRALPPVLRRSLMRRLAHEGYTLRQVQPLFDAEQGVSYARMVESYKRSLVCG